MQATPRIRRRAGVAPVLHRRNGVHARVAGVVGACGGRWNDRFPEAGRQRATSVRGGRSSIIAFPTMFRRGFR